MTAGLTPDELLANIRATIDENNITVAPPKPDSAAATSNGSATDDDFTIDGFPLLTDNVRRIIKRGNDRSIAHQALIRACVESQMADDAIVELVAKFKPSVTKYADRLEDETRRSITKARADYAAGKKEDEPADEEHKTMRDRLLTLDQLANLPPPRPLIDGILDLDNTGVIYGRRGHYKSFIALDMGLCVASGIPWHGHDTTQGVVVYVVAEAVTGVYQRVEAWRHVHPDADPGDRMLILPEAVNLLGISSASELATTCTAVGAILVFVDTLARCLVGGDENSSKDVGIAVETLDLVRRRTGAHVNAVHHSGKDPKAGARGSSALEAAADTVLEVTASETVVTVNTTKQKNRPEGDPIRFRAVPTLNSVVLEPLGRANSSEDLTRKDIEALLALDAIAGDDGAPFGAWAEAADEVNVSRTSVRRLRKKALDMGLIEVGPTGTKTAPRYLLTDDGRAKATGAVI